MRRNSTKKIPTLSYIISAYDRPTLLPATLWSIYAQTHEDFECLVTDNASDPAMSVRQRKIVESMRDPRFKYVRTYDKVDVEDCYWSAEYGMKQTTGQWLCFPCDDCYYPPEWGQRMLAAAYTQNLDLVLCGDSVTGPVTCGSGRYFRLELGTVAFPGYKPSFIVKRDVFPEWINKPTVTACSGVDRTTLQYMIRDPRIKWGVARDLFYVHN
jgi:glycosyltransferase involved in cell wall biosynthesis